MSFNIPVASKKSALLSTPTVSATITETMDYTETITPSVTPTITQTEVISATVTGTITSTITETNVPSDTVTLTITETQTNTPYQTFTFTVTLTNTLTITETHTVTPDFTSTQTPTSGATPEIFILGDTYVYPNPSFGRFKFVFKVNRQIQAMEIKIYTVAYRLVRTYEFGNYFAGNHQVPIDDMTMFANGIYHFILTTTDMEGRAVYRVGEIVILK